MKQSVHAFRRIVGAALAFLVVLALPTGCVRYTTAEERRMLNLRLAVVLAVYVGVATVRAHWRKTAFARKPWEEYLEKHPTEIVSLPDLRGKYRFTGR